MMKNLENTLAMTLTALFLLVDIFSILLFTNWSLVAGEEHSVLNQDFVRQVTHANLDFGLQVYQYLSINDKNVFVSPFSLSVAVAMMGAGSRGETWTQIKKALHLETVPDQAAMNLAFAFIIRSLTSDTNYTLFPANRIYVSKEVKLLPEYVLTLKESYNSSAQNLDFSQNNPKEVASVINKWVKQRTHKYIKQILTSDDIDADTAFLLINAVYFKGFWNKRFDARETSEGKFILAKNTESKRVLMMTMKANINYSQSPRLDCKVIELAYIGQRLVMYVLLPNELDGIRRLKSSLTPQAFESTREALTIKQVLITLPKFKLNYKKSLKETLIKLGVVNVFGEKADLSGFSESKTISVSKLIHESYVSVDEEGTEAAAISSGIANIRSGLADEPPVEFVADHPFVIIIYDTIANIVLFIGNVDEP